MNFDWIQFWKVVLTVGLGSFALLVLVVIPLGARDVLRLFRKLDANSVAVDLEFETPTSE